jgi:glutamate racemase
MIGVFDSGIGGLTVLKELEIVLPHESFLYLGDTARTPYGSKSQPTIERYALQDMRFLLDHGADSIVVACNTVSAVALHALDAATKTPVFDVVSPMIDLITSSSFRKIGVLGTRATVESCVYERLILERMPRATVYQRSCPLLVPIVEEGLADSSIAQLAIERYCTELRSAHLDALVLGCTHYPMLESQMQAFFGPGVAILNPAREVAKRVAHNQNTSTPAVALTDEHQTNIYLTDVAPASTACAQAWLGRSITAHLATFDD